MDDSIRVSILVPFYNVEQYFLKCLASIFTQTYQYVDYVFVDDCSPDNSLKILNDALIEYNIEKERYVLVSHKCNEGIAKSRIDCIENARGEYVYFVDADDWVEKEAIEHMVAACNNGEVDIIGCDFIKDFVSGSMTYHHEEYAESCVGNMLKCLNYDIATVLWKLLIRRELFCHFSISPINIGEDYIVTIKLFYYANSFRYIRDAFYHYVQYNPNRLSFQTLLSINDHIKCVNEVESFMRAKECFDNEVEHQLLLRKFNIKSNFVLNKNLLDDVAFNTTFPEAKGVWRQMNYSYKENLKFWLAEHGLFVVLKFFMSL